MSEVAGEDVLNKQNKPTMPLSETRTRTCVCACSVCLCACVRTHGAHSPARVCVYVCVRVPTGRTTVDLHTLFRRVCPWKGSKGLPNNDGKSRLYSLNTRIFNNHNFSTVNFLIYTTRFLLLSYTEKGRNFYL